MPPEPMRPAVTVPEPTTRAGVAGLTALLATPAGALVALDYDGTLAPIVERPSDATPAPGAVVALGRLAGLVGSVVILTGRPVREVLRLTQVSGASGLDSLVVLGHYGLERWDAATGETTAPAPDPGVEEARRRLPGLLAELDRPDGTDIEDKEHSLVVHTRRTSDPAGTLDALLPALRRLAGETGLELVPGRYVAEIRPTGMDKGAALRAFAQECAATAVLYAGDDLGDLPAYDAVEALRAAGTPGLTVCSDSAEVAELRARADLVLDGPPAVVDLLRALAAAIDG
ncbi:MAG: trehalose-phosphatase [Actinomycetota bacterium]|nr:trehalose-phosphatase [Actinomycetota bacterium]